MRICAVALYFLVLSTQGLLANLSPIDEVPSKRLAGGVHAFVINGSYSTADSSPADTDLDAKFKRAADDFEAYLHKVIPPTELIETIRLPGPLATKKELEGILQHIRKIQDNSLIIFYFCGHAFRRGDLPKEVALGASDTRPTCLALSGCDKAGKVSNCDDVSLPTGSIASVLDERPNLNFMVFLDCCYSGAAVPLLPGGSVNNRGFFLASSSRDEVSRNCDFTYAVLNVWRDGKFDKWATLNSFVAEVSGSLSRGKQVAPQFANRVLGNPDLPLGLLNLDACVLFLELIPPPAPAEYLISIKSSSGDEKMYQPSPGTTMVLLTVPRKECVLRISGAFPTWEESVDLSGQPYYPLQVALKAGAATKASTVPEQQAAVERDYEALLAQANSIGLPLATVGLGAIRILHASQPQLDTVPLTNTFLTQVDQANEQFLAETNSVKAARYLVRNEDFPINAEGKSLANALKESGIGGEALLSRFNYKCIEGIMGDPDRVASALAFESTEEAKDEVCGLYANALRHALVSGDEGLIRDESKRTLVSLQSKANVLSTGDLERLATLQKVAVATYEKRGVPVPPEHKPVDPRTIGKITAYRETIRASDVFKDSEHSGGESASKLMGGLIEQIDRTQKDVERTTSGSAHSSARDRLGYGGDGKF